MIVFDAYRPAGTRSQGFFEGPIRAGSVVGLDSAGFRPGFFAERQTQELISFAVIPAAGLPGDAKAFENITFVEAEVGEHAEDQGKVTIRSVSALGEWARTVWLAAKSGLASVPAEVRPAEAVLADLREALRSKESVLWTTADASAPVSAVCLIKCDSDKRAVVLAGPASYVVKV